MTKKCRARLDIPGLAQQSLQSFLLSRSLNSMIFSDTILIQLLTLPRVMSRQSQCAPCELAPRYSIPLSKHSNFFLTTVPSASSFGIWFDLACSFFNCTRLERSATQQAFFLVTLACVSRTLRQKLITLVLQAKLSMKLGYSLSMPFSIFFLFCKTFPVTFTLKFENLREADDPFNLCANHTC